MPTLQFLEFLSLFLLGFDEKLFQIEAGNMTSKVVRNDNVHKTNMMIRQLGTTPRDSVERETRELGFE